MNRLAERIRTLYTVLTALNLEAFTLRAMRLRLAIITCLLSLSLAFAQTCYTELSGALLNADSGQTATGTEAAHLLRAAVDLLEPVLPPLVSVNTFGLQPATKASKTPTF